ncbi:type VII secretion target [Saccharomonospora azurea]|uniref:Excreted virulence factor EspC, type VII ESX diderm n=1 Tax=Saccharomonospora azurea NA-128 TaxID=882081 RepID=H8GFL0_9PSEU|nr:type VII secretion target [Saccharomonospora azurea]EHK87974.1 hypothetical protein SZMC14600_07556 [Saccharomonospora azurea SZMC 14600]EHY90072.1 Protein of unknown function (DUF2580) [Saccharomonospora azurea NA-128]
MGGGFNVQVEALRGYRDALDDFGDQANEFKDLVGRADVGNESWGLVGLATKGAYTEALGELNDLLDRMQQGLSTLGDKFKTAADLYAGNDDHGAIQLGGYEVEIDKVDEARPAGA